MIWQKSLNTSLWNNFSKIYLWYKVLLRTSYANLVVAVALLGFLPPLFFVHSFTFGVVQYYQIYYDLDAIYEFSYFIYTFL